MRILYTLFIRKYYLLILLFSLFNDKAKLWINGRKNQGFAKLGATQNLIWIHASSLGEFEQGRPIIELIKSRYPSKKILLTFFSPSGFEARKNYKKADFVYYLPLDTNRNAKEFLDTFKPELAIFIKYEYWYNFLNELIIRNIPYYFVSSIYRKNQLFFKSWGFWFRKHLAKANHIFCQDENSKFLLESIGILNVTVAGDTRFDRVNQVCSHPPHVDFISDFALNYKTILAGSSWPADEIILKNFMEDADSDIKLILAPHNIDKEHIESIFKLFEKYKPQLFSETNSDKKNRQSRVLIIDSMGMLMHLYQYCKIAYIGGGFGAGIHNILEAAVFAKPVIFGPKYQKFKEAIDMISLGGAFSINNFNEFSKIANNLLDNQNAYDEASSIAKKYVNDNLGASEKIVDKIIS